MDLNNIIFTTDSDVTLPLDKLEAINVVHNIRDLKLTQTENEMILIESAGVDENTLQHHQIITQNIENLQNIRVINQLPGQELGGKIQIYVEDKKMLRELTNVCRCCLTECSNMQNLFDDENCIPEMIMAIASIQV